jgi:hypothetical protein
VTAQIANIDSARPEVQTAWYFFDTEDEAQMFVAGVREDLSEQELFDYVGHDVEFCAVGELETLHQWRARVDYIDRTPKTPEAA